MDYMEKLGASNLQAQSDELDRRLVEYWQESSGYVPPADDSKPFRHSDAGKCARFLGYKLLGTVQPDMPKEGVWVTRLGTEIHEMWQDALAVDNRNWSFEVPCSTELSSGHADAFNRVTLTVGELKTINGFGYKRVLAGGPKLGNLLQTAINAYALNAQTAKLVYLPLETNRRADPEFTIGCTFVLDRQDITRLAQWELARWEKIHRTVQAGFLPPRQIVDQGVPVGATVNSPISGSLDTGGRTWQCGYCPFQVSCTADGAGLVKVEEPKGVEDLW